MNKHLLRASALCLVSGGATAGALDRTGQPVDVLFEDGRYLEFSLTRVSPSLTGENISSSLGTVGTKSGDIGVTNFNFGAAYKADINETWSYAIIVDQPFVAEVDYPDGTGYFAQGSSAKFNSEAVTTLMQYNMDSGFSLYGGLRFQETDASAAIGFARGYDVEAKPDWGVGYVAGVAYERPEIALRVSLTYNSEIAHQNDVSENFSLATPPGVTSGDSVAEFETPQSVNLAVQSGIARNTLLFGSIRWVDWSDFDLSPEQYVNLVSQPLLSYEEDITTYTVGLGYRLNDTWSFATSLAYEENTGNLFTNLGPADGQTSIGLAAIYTQGIMEITAGIRYTMIGDTTTAVRGDPAAEFNGNDAVSLGIKVGFNF